MRSVGLKILKNKLSEYVRLAESGETVLVTDHDRVVAELVPPNSARSPMVSDAFLADLVRKGWLSPPLSHDPTPVARKPVSPWSEIAEQLAADRSDR